MTRGPAGPIHTWREVPLSTRWAQLRALRSHLPLRVLQTKSRSTPRRVAASGAREVRAVGSRTLHPVSHLCLPLATCLPRAFPPRIHASSGRCPLGAVPLPLSIDFCLADSLEPQGEGMCRGDVRAGAVRRSCGQPCPAVSPRTPSAQHPNGEAAPPSLRF